MIGPRVTALERIGLTGLDRDAERGSKLAVTFLQELLANGPVSAKEAEEAAEANGIKERTLNRAKVRLGVKAVKASFDGGWKWTFP